MQVGKAAGFVIARSRLRFDVLLAVCIVAGACSEPAGSGEEFPLTGVWKAAFAPHDSLRLYLVDSAGVVTGFLRTFPPVVDRTGTGSRAGVHLDITPAAPTSPTSGSFTLALDLDRDRLVGDSDGTPVEFVRTRPDVGGFAGAWSLTETRNPALSPDERGTDDLILAVDGRVGRHRESAACGVRTVGVYARRGAQVVFDYFGLFPVACAFQFRDTLTPAGATLLRRTPAVGGDFEEIYARR